MLGNGMGWRARARLGVGVIAAGALVAGVTAGSASAAPVRKGGHQSAPVAATADGAVRGTTAGTTDEFLGIPYAAPPVGRLRWRPPHPAARWHGVRDATKFAAHCPQPATPFGQASTSENCLFLNVFTPRGSHDRGRPLPVMVWIHGGALVTGESDDYDPAPLVRDGTIVVTINYRLGALGFLAHPALADRSGASGDYGLMDQQAALRWVQRNIRNFGGSPRNVTIFGESAGGVSVLSQLASPGSRGLFSHGIVESGSNLNDQTLAAAETAGEAFAAKAGCSSQTAACLRSLPVSAIVADENQTGAAPDVDGRFLTQSVGDAFASGQFNRVPVINGTNHDEYRLFVALAQLEGATVTAANYQDTLAADLGISAAAAAVVAAKYPLSSFSSPSVAVAAAVTDAAFSCPALSVDQTLSRWVPTFGYEFNDENAPEVILPPVSFPYGAAHASEIQYLFDLPTAAFPSMLSAQQEQLSAAMTRYWTNFAKRGFPSSFTQPLWPRFTSTSQRIQSLIPPSPQVETDFATEHNCAFWASAG